MTASNLDTSTKSQAAIAAPSAGSDGKLGPTMRVRTFITSIIAISAMCTLSAAPAHADTTGACAGASLSQPFLPWHDPGYYRLAPGGAFESRRSGWSLDGETRLVGDNKPFTVNGAADERALYLGEYGSATSPSICLAAQDPTLRFFVRNTGSFLSALEISINFTDAFGTRQSLPITLVLSDADWQPTLPIPIALNLLSVPLLSDGSTDVSLVFTPVGPGGEWTIDDVYVDPFKTK
ncbi:MAG: hypothetical protein QOJ13_1560 [Gaiellales bacterium]|nr:hypothetical protein [Gaiellales bacterium]